MSTQIDQITTEEIEQDIRDTEQEIAKMEHEIKAFRILGDRLSMMKADAREAIYIPEREAFIEKLHGILDERGRRLTP